MNCIWIFIWVYTDLYMDHIQTFIWTIYDLYTQLQIPIAISGRIWNFPDQSAVGRSYRLVLKMIARKNFPAGVRSFFKGF